MQALTQDRISQPTVIKIAERLSAILSENGVIVVPLLVMVLLHLSPSDSTVQTAMKRLVDGILTAILDLFPSTSADSSLFLDIRRLSHIALSFKGN
jgi:hypothetical protein